MQAYDKRQRPTEGFSLIELLIVALIVALLAGYVGPKLWGESNKDDKAKIALNEMKVISAALERYQLDTGRYPTTDQGLQALISNINEPGWHGPYLSKEDAIDPWGYPYIYRSPGPKGQKYKLLSLGADGKEGGDGDDSDITL